MFIGGLSWETTVDEMKEYFAKYGDVKDAGECGSPFQRVGFAHYMQMFKFSTSILYYSHLPNLFTFILPYPLSSSSSSSSYIPPLCSPSVIKLDPYGRSRGFGFILFADSPAVEKVLNEESHSLKNKKIEPKKVGAYLFT